MNDKYEFKKNFTFKYPETEKLNNNNIKLIDNKIILNLNIPNKDLGFKLKENMRFLIIDEVKENSILSKIREDVIKKRITRVNNNPIFTIDEFYREIKDKKHLELEIVDLPKINNEVNNNNNNNSDIVFDCDKPPVKTLLDLLELKNKNDESGFKKKLFNCKFKVCDFDYYTVFKKTFLNFKKSKIKLKLKDLIPKMENITEENLSKQKKDLFWWHSYFIIYDPEYKNSTTIGLSTNNTFKKCIIKMPDDTMDKCLCLKYQSDWFSIDEYSQFDINDTVKFDNNCSLKGMLLWFFWNYIDYLEIENEEGVKFFSNKISNDIIPKTSRLYPIFEESDKIDDEIIEKFKNDDYTNLKFFIRLPYPKFKFNLFTTLSPFKSKNRFNCKLFSYRMFGNKQINILKFKLYKPNLNIEKGEIMNNNETLKKLIKIIKGDNLIKEFGINTQYANSIQNIYNSVNSEILNNISKKKIKQRISNIHKTFKTKTTLSENLEFNNLMNKKKKLYSLLNNYTRSKNKNKILEKIEQMRNDKELTSIDYDVLLKSIALLSIKNPLKILKSNILVTSRDSLNNTLLNQNTKNKILRKISKKIGFLDYKKRFKSKSKSKNKSKNKSKSKKFRMIPTLLKVTKKRKNTNNKKSFEFKKTSVLKNKIMILQTLLKQEKNRLSENRIDSKTKKELINNYISLRDKLIRDIKIKQSSKPELIKLSNEYLKQKNINSLIRTYKSLNLNR